MAADNRLVTAEAVSLLRNLLQSPTLINSISNSVSPTLINSITSSVATPSNAAVNSEIRSLYEPGSSSMQTTPAPGNEIRNCCPRYETRATYSTWKSKPRQK